MADPTLTTGQYSIGGSGGDSTAMVYGGGASGIWVQTTETDTGNLNVQDQNVIGHDGMVFGIDTLPGMIITQSGWVYRVGQPATVMDNFAALAGKWNDPGVRMINGSVQVLRAYYRGSAVVRRAYGRGRKIMPTYGMVTQGIMAWTAQFQAADNTWYSDTENSLGLTMAPAFAGGGLSFPAKPPFNWESPASSLNDTIVNTGSMPTWPVITFTGPVSRPLLTYVNTPVSVGYAGTLRATDTLIIDTRPWNRWARLNGTAAGGMLSGDPMISLQLQPGSTVVAFSGQDYTGTATCTIRWRNATAAIGGSS